jgi:hypothetical protein
MGSESEVLSHRDSTPAQNAAKRGLLARKQEISGGGGVVAGAIRTRTMDPPSWGLCAKKTRLIRSFSFNRVYGRSSRKAADGRASASHTRQRTD